MGRRDAPPFFYNKIMAQLDPKFVEGLFYGLCQKMPTNSEVASIVSYAKSVRDAVSIIKRNSLSAKFFDHFNALSCNWMDHFLCVGECPSHFQALLLAHAGINRFVDLTELDNDYFVALPDNCSYYRATIKNDTKNSTQDVEVAVHTVMEALDRKDRVYLHCFSGRSRSAFVAAIVSAIRNGLTFQQGVRFVKGRRPVAEPHPDLLGADEANALIRRLAVAQVRD